MSMSYTLSQTKNEPEQTRIPLYYIQKNILTSYFPSFLYELLALLQVQITMKQISYTYYHIQYPQKEQIMLLFIPGPHVAASIFTWSLANPVFHFGKWAIAMKPLSALKLSAWALKRLTHIVLDPTN